MFGECYFGEEVGDVKCVILSIEVFKFNTDKGDIVYSVQKYSIVMT